MTKLVKFTRPMAPHVAGEERAVPDELAERLVAEGCVEIVPSVFDKHAVARETQKRQRYQTRGK